MSFGGINGAGPQGAPIVIIGNGAVAATPTPGYFSTSAESVLAAMSRGEIPANLGVSAGQLGAQVPLLQAISQGVPQNGTNGIGVSSGPAPGVGEGGETGTTFGGTQALDAKQMSSVVSATNQYSGN